jgi:cytidylate kinase
VGRGACFVIPAAENIRLRFIASLESRVKKVAEDLNVSADEARRQIYNVEAQRRSFTRRYFYTNIEEPTLYDLVINTDYISDKQAVSLVKALVDSGFKARPARG